MKKAYLFGLLALALGFTACDNIEDAPGKPQTNPEEAVIPADGFAMQTVDLPATPINLDALIVEDQPIEIAELTNKSDAWTDKYTFKPLVQLSNSDKFEKLAVIEGEYKNDKVYVTPSQMQDALVEVFGLNPIIRDAYIRIAMYAVDGRSSARIGGIDTYYGAQAFSAKQAMTVFVDEKYYLVCAAPGETPDLTKAIEMVHDSDENVYDDPVFNILIENETENAEWYVVPESTINGQMDSWLGAKLVLNGDTNEYVFKNSGSLEEGALADITPGKFANVSAYRLSINMVEKTYSVKLAYEAIYLAAKNSAWSNRGVKTYKMITDEYYSDYRGFGYIKDEFRFMTDTNYAKATQISTLSDEADALKGTVVVGGTTPSAVTVATGVYFADANLEKLTYDLTLINAITVVGTHNNWTVDAGVVMTHSSDYSKWTAEITTTADNSEFKIVTNNSWDSPSVGISNGKVEFNGSDNNFVVATPGTYVVTLDIKDLTVTCVAK